MRVEDVHRAVLDRRGFEEVVVHLGGARGPIDLPHAMVADHGPDGKIEEIRVYFSTRPLTGRATERAPLLGGDPELRLPPPAAAYLAEEHRHGLAFVKGERRARVGRQVTLADGVREHLDGPSLDAHDPVDGDLVVSVAGPLPTTIACVALV